MNLKFINKIITGVGETCTLVASVLLVATVLIGAVDVVTTNLFKAPVPSVVELTRVFLVVIVFLGFPQAQLKKSNIVVDIISAKFTGTMKKISRLISALIAMIFFFGIAWAGSLEAIRSTGIKEFASAAIDIPVWPAKIILALGAFLAGLVSLYCFFTMRSADSSEDNSEKSDSIGGL